VEIRELEDGLALLVEQHEEVSARVAEASQVRRELSDLEMKRHGLEVELRSWQTYARDLINDIHRAETTAAESVDMDALFDLEEELEAAQAAGRKIDEDRKAIAAAGSLLRDDGIKARIVRNYVPVINNLITKYLAALDFMCSFELDENFVETIRSRYRDDFTYESFSAGERLRITLAVLFAWRSLARLRCSVSTNLLVLDEVLDSSLDDRGSEEFLKLVSQLSEGTNTFIVSHNTDTIIDKFDRVIRFTKTKNFSRYEELG